MTARIAVSALALLAASAAGASVPVETHELACLANKENAAVVLELPAEPKVAEARLYFRRSGQSNRTGGRCAAQRLRSAGRAILATRRRRR